MKLPTTSSSRPVATGAAPDLATVWDMVYGQGYYVAHVLGARNFVQSTLKGNKGTVVELNLLAITDAQPAGQVREIKGVAKDNNQNIYKVVP